MPQVFIVVRCYSCSVFQVQQVKKVPKWVCKMCGEKQSLKKEYGRGSGADCRRHVQKLNMLKASTENVLPREQLDDEYVETAESQNPDDYNQDHFKEQHLADDKPQATASIWSQFIDGTEDEPPVDDDGESHQSGVFGASRITTDRDAVKSKRGRRGGKRGSGINHYGGRKRKYNQDELPEHLNLTEQNNHNVSSYEDAHLYSTSEEAWMEGGVGVADQMSKQPYSNYSTAKFRSLSKPPIGSQRNDKLVGLSLRSTVDKTESFPKRASKVSSIGNDRWGQFLMSDSQESKEQSQVSLGNASKNTKFLTTQATRVSSKWGQFLEEEQDTEEESYNDSLQDEEAVSKIHQQYQQESGPIGHCSLLKDCPDEQAKKIYDEEEAPHKDTIDQTSHSIGRKSVVDQRFPSNIGRKSGIQSSPEENENSQEETVDSLQSSSRWNVFLSNQSSDSSCNISQSNKCKRNQNFPSVNESIHNEYRYSPNSIESKKIQSLNKPCVGNAAEIPQQKTAENLFSIEDHHLEEIFSDDW